MERRHSLVNPGRPERVPGRHHLPGGDDYGGEVGVGGAHPAPVVHRDAEAPGDGPRESDRPPGDGPHRAAHLSLEVGPPVAGVGPLWGEGPHHWPGHGAGHRTGGSQRE
jgi:hypothetical protein